MAAAAASLPDLAALSLDEPSPYKRLVIVLNPAHSETQLAIALVKSDTERPALFAACSLFGRTLSSFSGGADGFLLQMILAAIEHASPWLEQIDVHVESAPGNQLEYFRHLYHRTLAGYAVPVS